VLKRCCETVLQASEHRVPQNSSVNSLIDSFKYSFSVVVIHCSVERSEMDRDKRTRSMFRGIVWDEGELGSVFTAETVRARLARHGSPINHFTREIAKSPYRLPYDIARPRDPGVSRIRSVFDLHPWYEVNQIIKICQE